MVGGEFDRDHGGGERGLRDAGEISGHAEQYHGGRVGAGEQAGDVAAQSRADGEGRREDAAGDTGPLFGVLKFMGNIASSWAGIPGGIFSPALAVGAGLGGNIASLLPGADTSTVVLLGMAAYLSGVTQAPLTAAVISIELTANHMMALPIMAACLLARAISGIVCRVPVYKALADVLIVQYEAERLRREAEATPDYSPNPEASLADIAPHDGTPHAGSDERPLP